MRFFFALLAAVAIHAALLVPLAIYFCKSAETGDLEELDVSAVELVLSENAVESPKEVFDELPQVAQLPEEPIVRGEFPRIDIPVVEIVASAPDMETVAAPHADLPSPPKLDMPVPVADAKSSRQVAATEPSPSKVEKKTPPSEVAADAEEKDVASLKFKARLPDSIARLPDGVNIAEKYYPKFARLHGKEGVVRLKLKINALVILEDVILKEPSGVRLLDEAAVKAVKSVKKFIPAVLEGEAVSSWTELSIEFRLKK
jgi:protein TonB